MTTPQNAARATPSLPTVWIVDDSALDAELTRRTLAALYRVEVFTDGAAVIEHFANESAPDAVILDWQMPGISGIDVCQFLRGRTQTQTTPILMLTVQHDPHDLVKCLAAGADDFLAKPYNAAELSARVAALIRSKRMLERLETAERAVRSLLMQLPEAVMSVDASGRVSFVNLEAERMLGSDGDAVVGRSFRDVLPEFALPGPPASGTAALADLVLRDRVYAPALRRYAGVDATETTLSFRDVTSERHHERERARLLAAEREARAQAEQASRAKDEFLAVVSHELRTPLNAILGWTRILRGGPHDEAKKTRALGTIERNAIAQQKLIEDILDVSRITSGKLGIQSSSVLLPSIVTAAVDATRLAADAKAIVVGVELPDEPLVVVGDPDRLQQVVWNLLSNAVKFTPRGGSVVVMLTIEGRMALVRVRDTGEGISPDFAPYLFDRFRQADTGTTRSHGGLGLGLSIVRHLVEMHGGSVEAESPGLGMGATFTVRLPLDRRASAAADSTPPPSDVKPVAAGDSLRGVRVLVVDDEPDARELVVEMLRQHAAEANAVGSTNDALRAVGESRPDVIVSDIGMPTDDGYALVQRLRRMSEPEGGGTPVVALTAFAAPRDRTRALSSGFNAYIAKPVESAELVAIVAKLAAQRALP